MFVTAIALLLSNASATASAPTPELLTGPIKMKASEIRAYNASLPRDHPNYIRCSKVEETGSIVKKKSICRTNQEWDRIEFAANTDAREAVDALRKGWSSGQ
jgi:hypothetical protein